MVAILRLGSKGLDDFVGVGDGDCGLAEFWISSGTRGCDDDECDCDCDMIVMMMAK